MSVYITDHLPQPESELLEKINASLPDDLFIRYNVLEQRRHKEQLSETEHKELLSINQQIEMFNAQRIQYLVELAQIRGVELKVLMDELEIGPS